MYDMEMIIKIKSMLTFGLGLLNMGQLVAWIYWTRDRISGLGVLDRE